MASPFANILRGLQGQAEGEGTNSALSNALRAFALQRMQSLPATEPGAAKLQGQYGAGGADPLQNLDFGGAAQNIFGVDADNPGAVMQGLQGLQQALPQRGVESFLKQIADEMSRQSDLQKLLGRRADFEQLRGDL